MNETLVWILLGAAIPACLWASWRVQLKINDIKQQLDQTRRATELLDEGEWVPVNYNTSAVAFGQQESLDELIEAGLIKVAANGSVCVRKEVMMIPLDDPVWDEVRPPHVTRH